MSAAAPTEEDLAAKAGALKSTETSGGGGMSAADPAVKALYEAKYDECGGDKDKLVEALGLNCDDARWGDISDKDSFLKKWLG